MLYICHSETSRPCTQRLILGLYNRRFRCQLKGYKSTGRPRLEPSSVVMSVPTTPWRLTVDNLLATKKYSDALLANKADPVPFLNTDRTVRPIQRYEPDLSEKRVLLVGQIPNIQPGLHMGIRGNRNSYPGRCVSVVLCARASAYIIQV